MHTVSGCRQSLFLPLVLALLILTPTRCFAMAFDSAEERQFILQNDALRSPLFVHSDRVLFLQCNGTLTALDIVSGAVLKRAAAGDDAVRRSLGPVEEWEIHGKYLLGRGRWQSPVLVNLDTLELHISFVDPESDPPIFGANIFMRRSGDAVIAHNSETGARTVISENVTGTFDLLGDRLVVFKPHKKWPRKEAPGPETLECFDAASGELLWRRELPTRREWVGMLLHEGNILVFDDNKDATHDGKPDAILAFASDGSELEPLQSRLSMFERNSPPFYEWPTSFSGSVQFMGKDYRQGRPVRNDERMAIAAMLATRDFASEKLGRKVTLLLRRFDDGGVMGLDYFDPQFSGRYENPFPRDPANPGKAEVYLIDGERIWQARAYPIEPMTRHGWLRKRTAFEDTFSFAANDKYVLYAAPNGKVECLDRATGRSRWLYSFPPSDLPTWRTGGLGRFGYWHWRHYGGYRWGESYYTGKRAVYARSLTAAEQRGSAAIGDAVPPATRVVVDPTPLPFPDDGAGFAALCAWGIPLASSIILVMLAVATRHKPLLARFRKRTLRHFVVYAGLVGLALNGLAFMFFARYSQPTMHLMLAAALLSALVVLTVGLFIPAINHHRQPDDSQA